MRSLTWNGAPEPHRAWFDAGPLERARDHLAREIRREAAGGRVVIVTSRNVHRLYRERFFDPLARALDAPEPVRLPDGEDRKGIAEWTSIFENLLANRIDRRDVIVAVGGGVLTDVAGFAAATFKRGLAWISVPTTLTGQVDAAIGGKTAVDFGAAKNMIGAFWQPRAVALIPAFFETLPDREIRCGLAEVVKTGLGLDARFFRWIERHVGDLRNRDQAALARVVRICAAAKLRVVAMDPHDWGGRAVLNLGHTVGHAAETAGKFRRWNHGECVATGMVVMARLAEQRGYLTVAARSRVEHLIDGLDLLPRRLPKPEEVEPFLILDKKKVGRRIVAVIPGPIGSFRLEPLDPQELVEARYWSGFRKTGRKVS